MFATDITVATPSWFLSGSITGASGAGARPHRACSWCWRMSCDLDRPSAADEEKGETSRENHLGYLLRLKCVALGNCEQDIGGVKCKGADFGQYASSRDEICQSILENVAPFQTSPENTSRARTSLHTSGRAGLRIGVNLLSGAGLLG
jgi:hypothetical protein